MDTATMTADDHALLVAWRTGDDDAFRRLVERHAPLVRAKCRRQLGDADAEDATQAVFLLLSRKPDAAQR
ncbi:MAG: RNA polymerase subunit sigma-70, partial [Planctomycetes bacterium]|nr:RNA polymerase subunit sigma-70 [Planctomycetota bacterium]